MPINQILKRTFELEYDLKDILEQKLTEYELSKTKVINLLNIDKDVFDDIINGTAKQPSLINVLKIANFLDLDLNEAVSAILKNQSPESIGSISKSEKALFVAKNFDIKRLSSLGFFISTDDVEYLFNRVSLFFGFSSVKEFEAELNKPLYSRTKRKFTDKMRSFWVKSAYQCFKTINNPNEYSREALKDLIVNLRPYSQDEENGLYTVCKALYNVGVTIIIQNHLPTTQVRGGTFFVNEKPCIVLTDLNKKYTTLWFALIHELHHVLYDLEIVSSETFHLSGEPDLLLIEDKANQFALDFFCTYEQYQFIKPHIKNQYIVSKFAKEIEIHPAFIYSTFQYYENEAGANFYWAFKDQEPEYSVAIKDLNPITWKEDSLSDTAKKIKSVFELNV